jgi:hypothetical protein
MCGAIVLGASTSARPAAVEELRGLLAEAWRLRAGA